VREFAADAVAYLLRVSPPDALRAGAAALVSEHSRQEGEQRTACEHAAGALLAGALRGTGTGLHSKAPALLRLLLPPAWPMDGGEAAAMAASRRAVGRAAFEALWHHLRRERGGTSALWDALLACTRGVMSHILSHAAAGGGVLRHADLGDAPEELVYGLECLAGGVEHRRGSRVEDYDPLVAVVNDLLRSLLPALPRQAPSPGSAAPAAAVSAALARLMAAILAGHAVVMGASPGPAAGTGVAAGWATLLPHARLPHAQAVLLASLLLGRSIPGGARAVLVPPLGAALAPAAVRSRLENEGGALHMCALCELVDPSGGAGALAGTPLWGTTADLALHAWLDTAREGSTGFGCCREGAAAAAAASPSAWTQLRVLPHCVAPQHASRAAGAVVTDAMALAQLAADVADTAASAAARLSRPGLDDRQEGSLHGGDEGAAQRLVALQGAALEICLLILKSHAPQALGGCASAALRYCSERPVAACLLTVAADTLDAWAEVQNAGVTASSPAPPPGWEHPPDLSTAALVTTWLPALAPALDAPCQAVRHSALRVLGHFHQPGLLPLPGASNAASQDAASSFFDEWCAVAAPIGEGAALAVSRAAAVTLGGQARLLRSGRVAAPLISSLARCALGGLRTRFAPLWPHCQDVLAACMEAGDAPSVFGLVLRVAQTAQEEALQGASRGHEQHHHQSGATAAEVGTSPGGTAPLPDEAESAFVASLLGGGAGLDVPDSTGGYTLLHNLLATLSRASAVVVNRAMGARLAPLFMAFTEAAALVGGKRHAAGLRDWLALVTALGGARGLGPHAAAPARQLVQETLLAHSDPGVQLAALACLRAPGKEVQGAGHLRVHGDQLARLIAPKTMRSQMAGWPMQRGAPDGVSPDHRDATLPLVLAILYPKLRTRRGRDNRGSPGAIRAAVFAYLAGMSSGELAPLIRRFLVPLSLAFGSMATDDWEGRLGSPDPGLLQHIDPDGLRSVPLRRRLGFLHTVGDVLTHLGEHATAFWDPLVGITAALVDSTLPFLEQEPQLAVVVALQEDERMRDGEEEAGSDDDDAVADDPDQAPTATVAPVAAATAVEPDTADVASDEDDEEEEGAAVAKPASSTHTLAHDARQLRGQAIRVLASAMRRHPVPSLWQPYWAVIGATAKAFAPRLLLDAASSVTGPPPPMLDLAAAIASSPELAQHVADDVALVPAVIAILGAPKASPASRAAATSILNGLLDAGAVGTAVLRPHALALLAALRDVMALAGSTSGHGASPLSLLVRLAPMLMSASDGASAAQVDAASSALVDALLPALGARKGKAVKSAGAKGPSDHTALRVLPAVQALFEPHAAKVSAEHTLRRRAPEVAAVLAPLFGTLRQSDARAALVDAFEAVAGHFAPAQGVVPLLRELNAPGVERLEGLDIGRQLGAYNGLDLPAFAALLTAAADGVDASQAAWLADAHACGLAPLLHQCLCDLRSPDMALRHAAGGTLDVFLRAAASVDTSLAAAAAPDGAEVSTRARALLTALVLPSVRAGVRGGTPQGRAQHVALLCSVVRLCPGAVPSLALLHTSGGGPVDPEANVWFNLTHVQMHRRVRALRRLGSACGSAVPSADGADAAAVAAYVAPLCEAALADAIPESGAAPVPELGDAAVEALAGCASALTWQDAAALLRRRLLAAAARPPRAKLETRAAAAIIGALRFGDSAPGGTAPPALSPTIITHLQRVVLPALADLVIVPDGEQDAGTVRPAAVLAAVKALKLLPPAAAAASAPAVLGAAAAGLRSRALGVRTGARQALCAAAVELGPGALPYLVDTTATALRQGFQKHVLGFTLHAILVACCDAHKGATPEEFGPAAEALAPLLGDDIFGEAADEKDAAPGVVAQWKEAKSGCRSFEALELLAQRAPFPAKAELLMGIVTQHLGEASPTVGTHVKTRSRCERALHALARGWAKHGHVQQAALLAFVHATLDDGVKAEKAAAAWKHHGAAGAGGGAPTALAPPSGVALGEKVPATGARAERQDGDDNDDGDAGDGDADDDDDVDEEDGGVDEDGEEEAQGQWPPHFELLTACAVSLLHMHLKSGGGVSNAAAAATAEQGPEDEEAPALEAAPPGRRALLDGMVPVLVKTVRSRHGPTCQGALRCLSTIMSLHLPQLNAAAPALAKRLHALLRRTGGTAHEPTSGAALRLWGAMLRFIPTLQPTHAQSTLLLRAAAADLETLDSSGASFNLLRALLARQPLPEEAHALMVSVRELMVRAHDGAVRASAQRALVQYLLAAPLGPRRFGQHLEFIVANLGYAHPDGRAASIACLCALVPRLPQDVLDAQAQYLLLPLVARLFGDPSKQVRAAAGGALHHLLRRVSPPVADACIDIAHVWLTGPDGRLRRAAAQLLGLCVEVQPQAVARAWRARLAPALSQLLAAALAADAGATAAAITGGGEDGEDDMSGVTAPQWQEAYYACTLLEKCWRCDDLKAHLSADAADAQIWQAAAVELLGHRHGWVRSASSRLLGAYCARCQPDGVRGGAAGGGILAGRGLAGACRASAAALAGHGLDEEQQSQVVRNLVFLASAAVTRALAAPLGGTEEARAADGEEEDAEDEDGGDEPGGSTRWDTRFAHWLLRRVATLGAPGASEQDRCAVLRWSAGVVTKVASQFAGATPEPDGQAAAAVMLLVGPAYRATEGAGEGTHVPPSVRSLGDEVLAHIGHVVPHSLLSAAITRLRTGAQAKRTKRRAERALEAVMDAGAAQRRRVTRAAKQKAAKQSAKAVYAAHKAKGTLPPEVLARREAKQARMEAGPRAKRR
jgi:hypothetical protein